MDGARKVPTEEQGVYKGSSRIYLSLDFSGVGVPKILTFGA
jgi:hypothetical protein